MLEKGMIKMKANAEVTIKTEKKTVTAVLSGEIDHHSAPPIRQAVDEAVIVFEPEELVLDFGLVSFMDSSGIGLVMGRYRLLEDMKCKLSVINLSPHAFKVMKLAGLDEIANLTKGGDSYEGKK